MTKKAREDHIAITRDDGTHAAFDFPKKGPVPHDAYHYFVERTLGMQRGFWGLVATGMDPALVGAMAAAGGHRSAKRAELPDAGIVELLQAERLVECFEAESWSGGPGDDAGIMAMAKPAWHASMVSPPIGVSGRLGAIRVGIGEFSANWLALNHGGSAELIWNSEPRGGI